MKTIKVEELETVYKNVIKTLTEPASENFPPKETFSNFFASSFFAIGITGNDNSLNYNEFYDLWLRQGITGFSGQATPIQCFPVFRSCSPDGQAAVYVDEWHTHVLKAGSPKHSIVRLSLFLFKMPEGWRVTHLHASIPVKDPGEVEIFLQKEKKGQHNTNEDLLEEKSLELRDALDKLEANQAKLIKQEKLASLGQLTAGIAHEIKNPLNFINNFSELSSEFLEEIEENLQKLEANECYRRNTVPA
jgi:hypothetical protein